MSTTLETFGDVEDADTGPHGEEGVDEEPLRCWYCWREAEAGSMAIDDPRREERDDDE